MGELRKDLLSCDALSMEDFALPELCRKAMWKNNSVLEQEGQSSCTCFNQPPVAGHPRKGVTLGKLFSSGEAVLRES